MRGFTIYLDEVIEERERERRRRSRLALGGAIVIALLGIGAAMSQPKPPKPEIIVVPGKTETIYVDRLVMLPPLTRFVAVTRPGKPPAPLVVEREVAPLFLGKHFAPLVTPEEARHLCVTPKKIGFSDAGAMSERVTISNPGTTASQITHVGTVSNRTTSGLFVDASECEGATLQPGERCTILVARRGAAAETMHLLIESKDQTEVIWIDACPTVPAFPASPESAW